ncbi:MAG: Magnesium and cobalt efflux protein CorC [Candidatus Anoxychlamydiales bacterium]|nr:Magnesium and cobalt efflux protein CorC [Candidatus Anoxychlamydiales bacterium]
MNKTLFFLFLALFCVLTESFFSMFEMAAVSLNKVKLHYRASKNRKKAKWLEFLLHNPSYLFGTTLIMVNTVMQIGSEAARRFYESLNLSPDIAPFTQTLIVLIFGELAPLFAARRHSEHVAYLSIPLVYLLARILTPLVWVIDKISKASNLMFKKPKLEFFLSKEELKKAIEEPAKKISKLETENINATLSSIFTLKEKKAKQIMIPISHIKMIPSAFTLKQIKASLKISFYPYFPIYHQTPSNIVAICYPRDLLNARDESRVIDFSKPFWFITEDMYVLDILKQFRTNNQSIAIVLDKTGKSVGIISLDQIEDEIFGKYPIYIERKKTSKIVIEKTLLGDMSLTEFNKKFKANLCYKDAKTLSDLITSYLGHLPSLDEVIHFEKYEFTIIETSLLDIEKVKVKTII